MESKQMLLRLALIAAFALSAFASLERDVISAKTIQAILEKTNSNVMLNEDAVLALTGKTLVSNSILDEALNHGRANGLPCGESCVYIPCISTVLGCSCSNKVCYRNSLAAPALEKDVITPETLEAVLKVNGGIDVNTKTVVSKTVLEEAFLNNANHGVNGAIPCGESCVYIPCISSVLGCSCSNKVCYKNSIALY